MCDCGGSCDMCRRVKSKYLFGSSEEEEPWSVQVMKYLTKVYTEVELKEKEKKMIKFEDVQVGDRVKLVNENGDTAESKITRVYSNRVYSELGSFWDEDGWSVAEILENPMPNKPGTILQHLTTGWMFVRIRDMWVRTDNEDISYNDNFMKSEVGYGKVKVLFEPK